MASPIPPRAPVGEPFSGALINWNGQSALTSLTTHPDDVQEQVLGEFTVRYGVRLLGKPHLSIVPGLLVLEYGEMLTGVDAWEFLTRRSNLHPRAEVYGYRNDGVDEMLLVRVLDLALPFAVLIYADPADIKPLAQVQAHIGTDNSPAYLTQYLPRYATFAEWKANLNV